MQLEERSKWLKKMGGRGKGLLMSHSPLGYFDDFCIEVGRTNLSEDNGIGVESGCPSCCET
eukprot:m.78378 g.78378  ORF g.78378 m.78378 type:complete len:61 (-) comp8573_c0_seq1:2802-2984(-)